jgi:hypothetical protein
MYVGQLQDGYKERVRSQTLKWAMGQPYHNRIDNECCPDFSCCMSDMFEKDEAKRWEYYHKHHGNKQ